MSLLLLFGGYAPLVVIPPLEAVGFIEGAGSSSMTEARQTVSVLEGSSGFGGSVVEGGAGIGG